MPFNVGLFANVYNLNFGNDVTGGEKQGDAGKGWAAAVTAGAATVLAPAPSTLLSAAESSMAGALAGWNSNTDNAGNMLKSAIQLYATTMAPGFAPAGVPAIPPAGPPPIDSAFPVGDAGADALTMGNQFGAILASWFPTGTYFIPGAPPVGPLPWL
mgnify:CR=1 FL=1